MAPAAVDTVIPADQTDAPPSVSETPLLLYNWACPYVQRVTLALQFKKATLPQIDIDLQNKPSWLTQYSPLGKVPAITYTEDGTQQVLYESLALVHWVDEYFSQQGPALLPQSPAQRTLHRIVISRFDNNAVPLFYKAVRATDLDEFRSLVETVRTEFTWLEKNSELAKNPNGFLSGAQPGLVDAVVSPWLLRYPLWKHYKNVDLFARHPTLKAYVDRLLALPEVQANLNSPAGQGIDAWGKSVVQGASRYLTAAPVDFSAVDKLDTAPGA